MKRNMIIFLLLSTLYLYGETIGLLSGGEKGTYIKIARDIKEITKKEMNIEVKAGGSLKNINKLLTDKHSQFAMVQYDALLYKKYIEGINNLDDKIKMIFPLYDEEIHIIVRRDSNINSVKDLNNKRVNTDEKMTGCWVTSQMIKTMHNLNWNEYHFKPEDALKKLIKNELDAFIYTIGKPSPLLKTLPKSSKSVIKLISPEVDDKYPSAIIPKTTYSWLDEDVKTNAIKAVLITYNYNKNSKKKRVQYYIENIRKLSTIINNNLESLRANGHPKWKEIDPKEYKKVKWPLHEIAKEAIEKRSLSKAEVEMLKALEKSK